MSKTHRVVINGGLGNQLFQVAALLSYPKKVKLELDLSLGQYQSSIKDPEFTREMIIPFTLELHREKTLTAFKRKIANGILVLSEKDSYVRLFILKLLLSMILFLTSGKIVRIVTCREISRFSLGKIRGNCLLIGYFQTAEWASIERVNKQLKGLQIRDPKSNQSIAQFLSQSSNPQGIHYRLGDYETESKFGHLSDSYYAKSMDRLKFEQGNIFLFSNDLEVATQRLKSITNSDFTPVPSRYSAVETLQLMRECEKLVIANSSLSWWGAFLGKSTTQEGNVVCPSPWFEFQASNEGLLPSTWVKVNPWIEESL